MTDNDKKPRFRCKFCGCGEIQITAWIDPNDNDKVLEAGNDGPRSDCWCPNCEDNTPWDSPHDGGGNMTIRGQIEAAKRFQGAELTADDVGVLLTPEDEGFGVVQENDVGKKCFVSRDMFMMENNEQRDARSV